MRRFNGKTVVLAGGSGGLGSATARRLAAEGASLVIGDLDETGAASLAREINDAGGTAVAAPLDLAEEEQCAALVKLALDRFGHIDGVHANGAYLADQHLDTTVLDIDFAYWDRAMAVNLKGYVYMTRHALPPMLEQGQGAFVYTSSGAVQYGEGVRLAYAASKAGVEALARHVASGWGQQGIRANVVAPGMIMTPPVMALEQEFRDQILGAARVPRLGEPKDIAGVVAMLLSDDAAYIQAQVVLADGGLVR